MVIMLELEGEGNLFFMLPIVFALGLNGTICSFLKGLGRRSMVEVSFSTIKILFRVSNSILSPLLIVNY